MFSKLTNVYINFGDLRIEDHKATTLVVNNLSEVPLVYRVRKTGSMASLDLKIAKEDRMGIIRPYRNRVHHMIYTLSDILLGDTLLLQAYAESILQ
jgi:hypothetical protein